MVARITIHRRFMENGKPAFSEATMSALDAKSAVRSNPEEWSMKPWPAPVEKAAKKAKIDAEAAAEAEAAKAAAEAEAAKAAAEAEAAKAAAEAEAAGDVTV